MVSIFICAVLLGVMRHACLPGLVSGVHFLCQDGRQYGPMTTSIQGSLAKPSRARRCPQTWSRKCNLPDPHPTRPSEYLKMADHQKPPRSGRGHAKSKAPPQARLRSTSCTSSHRVPDESTRRKSAALHVRCGARKGHRLGCNTTRPICLLRRHRMRPSGSACCPVDERKNLLRNEVAVRH
jgi:hypothetical protein